VLRSRSVLVEASPLGQAPPVAFADGERLGPLPLRADVRPGAVRVLA
jgi:diacylglycerol kinase (ATP)